MTLTLKRCALALIFALSPVVALSQETTTDSEEAAESAEPITEENAAVGDVYVKETHGDWRVRCVRAELGQEDRCQMIIVLFNQEGEPVSEFLVSKVSDDEIVSVATLRTPLEVLLPPGIEVGVDGNPAGRVPYLFCTQRFCQSEIQLRDKDVGVFKRGGKASMTMVVRTSPPQRVVLDVSLNGFTKAYDSLATPPAPAPAPAAESASE